MIEKMRMQGSIRIFLCIFVIGVAFFSMKKPYQSLGKIRFERLWKSSRASTLLHDISF